MDSNLKIAELSDKLQSLIDKTYEVLENTNNAELEKRLKTELQVLENRTDLTVAFVGQYSSGKSTIISAITGNKDIQIDSNVATDKVSEYRWNNIVLLDTPGILAGKVERHDERTKEALKNTDLIVYVITSQLFDDIIFENFIDLAYNQALKDKMLIAVNKMSMEAGEFEVLQKNYTSSIKSIFNERGYEFDFEIVFIDAADYIEGIEDNDEEFIQLSNFNKFISVLNDFVNKKGLIKKQFDTPIRLLKGCISDIAVSEIDPNLQILLEQGIKKITGSKRDIERAVRLEISKLEQDLKNKGYEVGNMIGECDEETFEKAQDNYNHYTTENVEKIKDKIEKLIEQENEELITEIEEFTKKDAVIAYKESIERKLENNISLTTTQRTNLEKQRDILNFLQKGSGKVANMAIGNASLNGMKAVSGSNLHQTVYSVGKFFGHNFKPWGAVKIAGKIGKVAKFVGPALSGLSLLMDIHEKKQEEKRIKEIRAAKDQFFASIRDFVSGIINDLETMFSDYIKNSYDDKLDDLNNQKIEIVNLSDSNEKLKSAISKLDSEYIDFIEIIEN
jgi:putative GTPase